MGKTPKDYSENPGEYILKPSDNSQEKFQSRDVSSMLRQPSPSEYLMDLSNPLNFLQIFWKKKNIVEIIK